MPETVLEVQNLSVDFDNHKVLGNISFSVQKGQAVAIVGPNGAGKSVMLRSLLGLIPHSGTVKWHGDLKVNYIPQNLDIDKDLPLSIKEFLNFKEKSRDKIISILGAVGLTNHHNQDHLEKQILDQRLGWLSGGQLQRVMIAWSLIDKPDVLLFDEPTSGIDVGGEETIYNLIKRFKDADELTVLLISHDLNIVYKYADTVICLNRELICRGTPSEVLDPASLAKLYGGQTGFYQHHHS